MGTISVSLPSDGQTIDAADYNVPINTIVSEINGGLDSDNIAASGVVPNSLFTGTGTSWAWASWAPTLSGRFTDGDWTKACKFIQIGKTVFCKLSLTSTDATPMAGGSGQATFTLPVTATALSNTADTQPLGESSLYDLSVTTNVTGAIYLSSTTTACVRYRDDAAGGVITGTATSTTPFTWASGDEIVATFIYEAA